MVDSLIAADSVLIPIQAEYFALEGLADLMRHYMTHKDEYSECGENAKKYFVRNFTLEKYINGLEEELQQLVKLNKQ